MESEFEIVDGEEYLQHIITHKELKKLTQFEMLTSEIMFLGRPLNISIILED